MSEHDYSNLGKEIKDMVTDAVTNMDFEKLSENIGKTVNSALDEARKGLQKGADVSKNYTQEFIKENQKKKEQIKSKKQQYTVIPFDKRKTGRIKGAVFTGVGGVLMGSAAIVTFVFFWTSLFGSTPWLATIIPLVITGGCGVMFGIGNRLRAQSARFRKYMSIIGNRTYCELRELALRVHKDERFVLKDLRSLISKGAFPEAHISEDERFFLGDYQTYQQFIEAQKGEQLRLEEEEHQHLIQEKTKEELGEDAMQAIEKGREFVSQIREANDRIPGEEISKKLDVLELVTNKIFERVTQKPEQLTEIKRFMEYYLPTTLKLVQAYAQFDAEPVQGENILKSKKEIEKTIDTINTAFSNLYNSLFDDDAMDVASDISVLNAMFAQEGLTKKDFK